MTRTSNNAVLFDLRFKGETPYIVCGINAHPDLDRIKGHGESPVHGAATFPGYEPSLSTVLHDIDVVLGDRVRFTDKLAMHIATVQLRRTGGLPADFRFVTDPYEHQTACVTRAYYQDRIMFALDMGLGKTKIAIDCMRLWRLRSRGRTLIVCPSHLATNWEMEIRKHSDEDIRVLSMLTQRAKPHPVQRRISMYTGTHQHPFPESRFALTNPELLYDPLPEGLVGRLYEQEDGYVAAILSGDKKLRAQLRKKLKRNLADLGHALSSYGAKLRKLPPLAEDYDVVIVSYGIAVHDRIHLQELGFSNAIFDESHRLRGMSTETTKGCFKLVEGGNGIHRRALLTGTPSGGDPRHLFGPLRMICPSYTGNYFYFNRRYTDTGSSGNTQMVFGFKNLHILADIVDEVSVCMKTSDCVDLDLPVLNVIDFPVTPDPILRRSYNELVATHELEIEDEDGEQDFVTPAHAADRLTKLRQVLSGFINPTPRDACMDCDRLLNCVINEQYPYREGCVRHERGETKPKVAPVELYASGTQVPRLNALQSLLEPILDNPEHKVIVWCSFRHEMIHIQGMLDLLGYEYVVVNGDTSDAPVERAVFNTDPNVRVYLSIVNICDGFNLVSAQYTVYYSLPFNYIQYRQSMKRNHRIGQDKPVTVYRLYVPGSVDEGVMAVLSRKKAVANSATDALRCGFCGRVSTCTEDSVLPFDPDCLYDRTVKTAPVRPRKL